MSGGDVAFVNGVPHPAVMTRAQVSLYFPQGLPVMRHATDGSYAFADGEGTLTLKASAAYTTISAAPQSPAGGGSLPTGPHGMLSASPRNQRHYRSYSNDSGVNLGVRESPAVASVATLDLTPTNSILAPCKTFLDRVHDHMGIPRFICDLIDTSEFQRLRTLKQIGNTHYVYPGATHTRFEHSIGVAHLAMYLARKLQVAQPSLQVSDVDVLCVMAAGLCHDIGHGPFSHLFEAVISRVFKERGLSRKWHHEQMSTTLVRRMLGRLDISEWGLGQEDVEFIVLCIDGLAPGEPWPTNVGRPASKRFLLDIVANKRNGVDVDKLDYFMRDAQCCFGRSPVDCHIMRLLNCARVLRVNGVPQICFEEKLAHNLGDIFALRAKMHKYAYQHRVCRVVDLMVTDALLAAEPFFTVRGADGVDRTLLEALDCPDAFVKLGDWILNAIDGSADSRLKPAQAILRRIAARDMYRVVGQASLKGAGLAKSKADFVNEVVTFLPDSDAAERERMKSSLAAEFISITYGSTNARGEPDDPVSHVSFFSPKRNSDQAFSFSDSHRSPLFSPINYQEKTVLFIVRETADRRAAMQAVDAWKNENRSVIADNVPNANQPAPASFEEFIAA